MSFLWATRGRTWGFRFLRRGEGGDPLLTYDAAFRGHEDEREGCWSSAGRVALRFPDPEGRRDEAGRVIPHEFVLLGPLAAGVDSLQAGKDRIWPVVAEEYAAVWDAEDPQG
ncbi:hypothetical protein [Brachybacterium sp. YJGR34]|uniref:hypothetical protein n=1 Tax=Brachybacterium sp. YJGR34 TaxID=2059911 RepID=UPI000E0AE90E|nr:hypothetical protein [Brachybacterium sp. YJGR34]